MPPVEDPEKKLLVAWTVQDDISIQQVLVDLPVLLSSLFGEKSKSEDGRFFIDCWGIY
jgi:hypothetical protein